MEQFKEKLADLRKNGIIMSQYKPLDVIEELINVNQDMYEMLEYIYAVMFHFANEPTLPEHKRTASSDDSERIKQLLARARCE